MSKSMGVHFLTDTDPEADWPTLACTEASRTKQLAHRLVSETSTLLDEESPIVSTSVPSQVSCQRCLLVMQHEGMSND
jgi:hypothetical protein